MKAADGVMQSRDIRLVYSGQERIVGRADLDANVGTMEVRLAGLMPCEVRASGQWTSIHYSSVTPRCSATVQQRLRAWASWLNRLGRSLR